MQQTSHSDVPEPIIMLVPELAVLAILDEVIGFALCALFTAHPNLAGNTISTPAAEAANQLIDQLHQCQAASARYRCKALAQWLDTSDDDIPF